MDTLPDFILDGIVASEAIDASGEQTIIEGADISTLQQKGVLNYEHKGEQNGGSFLTIVGRCVKAKKIFSSSDCENDRERMYWNRVEVPFIYAAFRLFRGHENAEAAISILRDQHLHQEEQILRLSAEGHTLERDDNILKRTIIIDVALTKAPCNKTAVTNVLYDPQAGIGKGELDIFESNKKSSHGMMERITSIPLSYSPYPQEDIAKNIDISSAIDSLAVALDKVKTLVKTMGGMPGSQVGMGALERESVSPKIAKVSEMPNGNTGNPEDEEDSGESDKEELIEKLKQLLQTYSGESGSLKDYVRENLPEIPESILDSFDEIEEDLEIKPSVLSKAEPAIDKSSETNAPGKVRWLSGPDGGKEFDLVSHDSKSHHVIRGKNGGLMRVDPKNEGSKYEIVSKPTKAPVKNLVSHEKHAVKGHAESDAQKELLNGLDLSSLTPIHGNSFTSENGGTLALGRTPSGRVGVVKSSGAMNPARTGLDRYNSAQREAAFHHLANNVFGLGEHVPVSSAFQHPVTGEHHSIQELVPEAKHWSGEQSQKDTLHNDFTSGKLDKMALMDMVLGNDDRHAGNWMMSHSGDKPELRLIDNGLSFSGDKRGKVPSYWSKGGELVHGKSNDKWDKMAWMKEPLHPEAVSWVNKIDPEHFKNEMGKLGVPQDLQEGAINRLQAIKEHVGKGNATKIGAFLAPFRQNKDESPSALTAFEHNWNSTGSAVPIPMETNQGTQPPPPPRDPNVPATVKLPKIADTNLPKTSGSPKMPKAPDSPSPPTPSPPNSPKSIGADAQKILDAFPEK